VKSSLPGHRHADPRHPALHRRHPRRAPFHERAACDGPFKPSSWSRWGVTRQGKGGAVAYGALVGSDAVFDALVRPRRGGAVNTILRCSPRARAVQPYPAQRQPSCHRHQRRRPRRHGDRSRGGPGVRMAELSPRRSMRSTRAAGQLVARQSARHHRRRRRRRYRAALDACLADDNVDGVMVMPTPQDDPADRSGRGGGGGAKTSHKRC